MANEVASFVETYDEPYHRRRFENDFARVYDVLIPAGATTLYHRHTLDTLYVSIAAAKPQEQVLGQAPQAVAQLPAGVAMCRNHYSEPLIHQVTNHGGEAMRLIGVEMKATPATVAAEPLSAAMHEFKWHRGRLRVYKLEVPPGSSTGKVCYSFASVTIALCQASLEVQDANASPRSYTCEAGDVVWQEGPHEFSLTNIGENPYVAYLGEWC